MPGREEDELAGGRQLDASITYAHTMVASHGSGESRAGQGGCVAFRTSPGLSEPIAGFNSTIAYRPIGAYNCIRRDRACARDAGLE